MAGSQEALDRFERQTAWPMMALGIFTAFLQAYVFALLSGVYVGAAVAHEEH